MRNKFTLSKKRRAIKTPDNIKQLGVFSLYLQVLNIVRRYLPTVDLYMALKESCTVLKKVEQFKTKLNCF